MNKIENKIISILTEIRILLKKENEAELYQDYEKVYEYLNKIVELSDELKELKDYYKDKSSIHKIEERGKLL